MYSKFSFLGGLTLSMLQPLSPALAAPGQQAAQTSTAVATRMEAFAFDGERPYPSMRLLELYTHADGTVRGTIVSDWYGTIDMGQAQIVDGEYRFDVANLNDADNRRRVWTVRRTPQGLTVSGQLWYAKFELAGRVATPEESDKLRFTDVPLPPMGALPPDGLAQRPPMGWSSWNKFATQIDDRTIRGIADAMVSTGLRDAGYIYINIDDGWQGERLPDGTISANAHFPDMKGLADYLHARGLKLGLYTSPGPRTCAGFEGSYGHVQQDAQTFADWGVDYLKYDLCSGEWFYDTADKVMRTYYEMGEALRRTGRPMVYSLCAYGRFNVGSWGRAVGGHLWRTTGDITDEYDNMARIGFDHNGHPLNTGPGAWNDPDMLEIGNGGMTTEEYRTHMTLWAMSAAPLILGNDVRNMSAADLALALNPEVIAVDQDSRGVQGRAVWKQGQAEVWTKPLADGTLAIALFNRSEAPAKIGIPNELAGQIGRGAVRDLWTRKNLRSLPEDFTVPGHGAVFLKVAIRH